LTFSNSVIGSAALLSGFVVMADGRFVNGYTPPQGSTPCP
jgi:hypothetical protein